MRKSPLLALVGAGLAFAIATAVFFECYSVVSGGEIVSLGLALIALSPVAIVASAVAALARRGLAAVALSQLHAALFTTFIVLSWATHSPGHSSFADSVSGVILGLLAAGLLVEIVAMLAASIVLGCSPVWRYAGLTLVLLSGWSCGVFVWSERLPARVVPAAEAAAGERPYCLDVNGRPADSSRDLVGLRMTALSRGGYTWNFHALLVIDQGSGRTYMNWSYRRDRFEPVSDNARQALHLDRIARCTPFRHLARGWA